MKPIPHRKLTIQNRIYNYRQSRGRRIVENAFGQLVSRFQIFKKPINLLPDKVDLIVMACISLHNLLNKTSKHEFTSNTNINTNLPRSRHNNSSTTYSQSIRNELIDYYSNEGAVSWQNDCI